MLQSFIRTILPWRTLVERVEKPMTGMALTASLVAVGLPYLPAHSSETSTSVAQTQKSALFAQTNSQIRSQAMADGVYVYGQSSEPAQLGAEYLVFEVNQGQVVGGFYMPRSSFDCFYGNLESNQLALTVVDSYEQTLHPYAVALESGDAVAMAGEETIAPVSLEGYHAINTISDVDRQVLSTCKADYQKRV